MTASGSDFVSGSQIDWNGDALTTTYVSSTSLTAQVPASDLTTAGTVKITVQSSAPGGGTSSPLNFTINVPPNPLPTISSLSPSTAFAGAPAFTLTVAGTQFVSASQVLWNGSALATTFVSNASLTALIPAADLSAVGTATVAVQNPAPGGGISAAISFAITPPPNPVPTITSLSPSSAPASGLALTLTVAGTQFLSTSQVLWNGSPLTTSYGSSTSLTAPVPASDLGTVGTATVAVQNPMPGGGTSGNLTFTINPITNNLTILSLVGNDIVWDPSQKKIYVAVPSNASVNPGTITVVDPIAGSIGTSQALASAPSGFAISDDSQYLYAVIGGGATIQRLPLPALTPDIQYSLGTDRGSGQPNLIGDIKVQPKSPHSLAVSFGEYGSGSVAVFDDAVERSGVAGGQLGNSLQWKADGSELYAASTSFNDSPYFTPVSDSALCTMPVTSAGVGAVTTYNYSLRGSSAHLHSDATTGYVYGDWGEVVNPANGIPVGDYPWIRTYGFAPPSSVVDSSLNRFYTLDEVYGPNGTMAFQIQSFDATQFRLLSTIVIPDVEGPEPSNFFAPANLIRWGESGLAFVVNDPFGTSSGHIYLLDGAFVNPSGVQDTVVGSPILPVPTLTAVSPLTATVGSGAVTLEITGRDFSGQPTVYWNGNALPTTVVSSTQLSAQVPATDLAATTLASITASNGSTVTPGSNSLPFSVNPAPPAGTQISVYSTGGNNVVWDATTAKLYVSMPGIQGDAGNAIGIVDPMTGTVTSSGFLGSEPAALSLSSGGQYLYMALYGENAVQQLTLPNLEVNASWNLGGGETSFGPYYALDVEAAPGAAETTAVVLANFDVSPSPAEVVIYDGSTARPNLLQAIGNSYCSLQWAGVDSTLYAVDQSIPQSFFVLGVSSSGAVLNQAYSQAIGSYSPDLHYDPGTRLGYMDGGQVIQPSSGMVIGSYGASGIAVPDSTLDEVFILGQTSAQFGTSNYTLESFDQAKYTAIASLTIDNVVGTPTSLIRWGSNGLAFTTRFGHPYDFLGIGPGQLYVISGDFVKPPDGTGPAPGKRAMLPVRRTWGLVNNDKSR